MNSLCLGPYSHCVYLGVLVPADIIYNIPFEEGIFDCRCKRATIFGQRLILSDYQTGLISNVACEPSGVMFYDKKTKQTLLCLSLI